MVENKAKMTAKNTVESIDFTSFDGVNLKVHEMGEGRPLFLLHGLFSNAHINWIKYGHADILVDAGYHLIMPDLRAHGQSGAPQEAEYYPKDVIIHDMEALMMHYGFKDYDMAGFSLGARSCVKLLINGARPKRLALGGMGWEGLNGWSKRQKFFRDVITNYHSSTRGDAHYMPVQFMKTTGIDPIAAGHFLNSFGTLDVDVLKEIFIPTIVICGDQDQDNGSGELLASHLNNAKFAEISGNHMSSVTQKSYGLKMAEFFMGV